MENAQRPTMRSRKLGQRLRAIREERGLTLQQAARVLNRTPSSLSKLETGKRGIRRPALENMLDRYQYTDPEEREALFDLARNGTKQGWWLRYEGKISPSMLDYISLEAEALSIESFQLHLLPGLLQTDAYTRAVIECCFDQGFDPDVDGLTEVRMRRQQILFREKPPRFRAIASEAALRQRFGSREVMKAQLTQLIERSQMPNVTLQLLPFLVGGHGGINGSFSTLTTRDLSVVLVENLTTGWYLEEAEDVSRHHLVFDRLREAALSPSDSRALIERILSET
ncbi:helix-turn-helix domain-containing protein [Actinomadura terrae]|uniref:helix-turn-helix domain-containing protein n=1 Tax=Actinomadura terrae TaxID=604353 RepID=UPI001FA7E517|nr:helix-turn-helix transcriptional regulator [Actinomadura terrae]